jgi:hypothetical protein
MIEKSREVTIPNVGRLPDIEHQRDEGEVLGLVSRPTGEPSSPASEAHAHLWSW